VTPRAILLINPASGRGLARERARELRRQAAAAGVPVAFTRDAEDVARRSRDAVARGIERVVVAGGDGTAHYAIRGLRGTECALGVVPVGSGNDLARALGLPFDLDAAFRIALDGPLRRFDLGVAAGVPFASTASVGLDSDANRFANEAVPWLRGLPLYLYAALRTIAAFEPLELHVECDGGRFDGRVMLAVVANTGWYGGGMRVAPAARPDDGRLDVVVVEEVSRVVVLRWLPAFMRGGHLAHPKVRTLEARSVHLTPGRPVDVFCDGERVAVAGPDPLEVHVEPGALWVATLAPKTG
jgi:diacylglycerol kinase (ATP)